MNYKICCAIFLHHLGLLFGRTCITIEELRDRVLRVRVNASAKFLQVGLHQSTCQLYSSLQTFNLILSCREFGRDYGTLL